VTPPVVFGYAVPDYAVPEYLHQISVPTPFPVGPVNVYLAEGATLTLVDAGPRFEQARQALKNGLVDLGHRVGDLRRVIVTHAHADHYGLASELARVSGAEVWAHKASVSRLAGRASQGPRTAWLPLGNDLSRTIKHARMMQWAGVPVPVMLRLARMRRGMGQYAEPLSPSRTLADGDVVRLGPEDWHVLHTPGHTGGLVCLYQPERHVLISSDHLLRDISSNPVVDVPEPGESEPPRRLVQYLQQLRRVAELDVAVALPGHGPLILDHRALVQSRLSFHEERAGRILETLNERAHTAYEVAGRFFPQLDPINRFLAISEVIGHLQWLETDGRVVQVNRGGVARWQAIG
jgi:glyoxylase-like metal-dependent hydrolase (beta-lactamase superfamily II)